MTLAKNMLVMQQFMMQQKDAEAHKPNKPKSRASGDRGKNEVGKIKRVPISNDPFLPESMLRN